MLPLSMRITNPTPIVEMIGITKRFPGVIANNEVNFCAWRGELHALVGENGAGKTTLMNILYGLHKPDSGEIRISGQPVKITNPKVAINLGIGMVHQHFSLVRAFTALENIILGDEPVRSGVIDYRTAKKNVLETCEKYNLHVDLNSKVENLSVSSQQKVEILRALYRGVRILILDEPTSVLAPQEAEGLFTMLRRLTSQGTCVILISHKLPEVMTYSDRITILRQGRSIATVETKAASADELTSLMVGSDSKIQNRVYRPTTLEKRSTLLSVQNLSTYIDNKTFGPLSFDIHSGEVVGIAGIEGSGQKELVEALVGLRKASGRCLLENRDILNLDTRRRIHLGIAYIPEDRFDAIASNRPVLENAILSLHRMKNFCRYGVLNYNSVRRHTARIIEDFAVQATGVSMTTKLLSGGNQQKLILGRALSAKPKLLIICQPTRGLDTKAVGEIHQRIRESAKQGTGVLLVSYDLDELLTLSDRILVISRGQITGMVAHAEATREKIGAMMLGATG
jgi:ABC-type uncharacterized transport system ATPase subunit